MTFPSNRTQTEIDYLQDHGPGGLNQERLGDQVAYLIKAVRVLMNKLDADITAGGATETDYEATMDAVTIP